MVTSLNDTNSGMDWKSDAVLLMPLTDFFGTALVILPHHSRSEDWIKQPTVITYHRNYSIQ